MTVCEDTNHGIYSKAFVLPIVASILNKDKELPVKGLDVYDLEIKGLVQIDLGVKKR